MVEKVVRDDYVPELEYHGIAAKIDELSGKHISIEDFICHIRVFAYDHGMGSLHGFDLYQVEHLIADLGAAGKLKTARMIEGSNAQADNRPVAVSGIGITSEAVWFGTYEGLEWKDTEPQHNTGVFRFYLNGELAVTQTNYYRTTFSEIEAALGRVPVAGDKIQIAQVVNGIVGWWNSISVP